MKRLCALLFSALALSPGLWGQASPSISDNLDRLESLMLDSQNLLENTLLDNETLKAALTQAENESENLKTLTEDLRRQSETQKALATEQERAFQEQSEISRKQSALLGRYEAKLRRYRLVLIAGLLAAAGIGILAGLSP
ncbi:MAG: hypothetical protein MdMp014T_2299 [Treponematales bacterium]